MKKLFVFTLFLSFIHASSIETLGVETSYINEDGDTKSIIIKREKPTECYGVKFDPDVVLGGDAASKIVPSNCKRSFVTYMGKISPIKFSKDVETYGEVEVLEFIEKATEDKNLLLVDSRTAEWFYNQTIPSAVNVPYLYSNKSQYINEFNEMIKLFGVKEVNGNYDFSNAKTLLLFCNGVWCGQSPEAMKHLIKIGYPQNKLKWYRGGIQSWISLGLPTIKPE